MNSQLVSDAGNGPLSKLVFPSDFLEQLHLCPPIQPAPPFRAHAQRDYSAGIQRWAKLDYRNRRIEDPEGVRQNAADPRKGNRPSQGFGAHAQAADPPTDACDARRWESPKRPSLLEP